MTGTGEQASVVSTTGRTDREKMMRTAAEEVKKNDKQRAIRVLLVDDHEVVRKGIRLLIETFFEFEVFEAGSAQEAVALATSGTYDLILMDARMPEFDGIWAIRQIRQTDTELPILVLSTYDTEDYVDAALEAGANGYVLKESSTEQLREAVDTALSGRGLYLHPAVAQRVFVRGRRSNNRNEDTLSARELEVLQLLSEGATNQEIAALLFVSEKTVKAHLSSIFRKMSVTNRTQAAAKAIRERIVRSTRD